MKKTFLLSLILLLASVGLAQAEHSIVPQVAVMATERGSHETATKPAIVTAPAPAKYAGPTLKQIGAEFSRQATALESKSAEEKKARESNVDDALRTVNVNVVRLNEDLTGKKGEFAKLSAKVDAVPSAFGNMLFWLFIGTIFVVALATAVIVLVLKKDIKAVPEKTTEKVIEASVNASQPDCFVVKINGRNFSYTYQADGSVLFVRDDGSIAKFTDRNQANRSLFSTFKNLRFNSKGELRFDLMSEAQANAIKTAIVKKHFGFQ